MTSLNVTGPLTEEEIESSSSEANAKVLEELNEMWKAMLELVENGRIDEASELADKVLFVMSDSVADGTIYNPTIVTSNSEASSYIFQAINRVMAKNACRLIRALAGESP